MLVPLGVAAFVGYLYARTGDPLAFIHAQTLWGRGASAPFSEPIQQNGLTIAKPWNFVALNLAAALLMIAAGCSFLVRRQWSYAAYTLLSVAVPLSSGSLQSLSRYALVDFPLFLLAGRSVQHTGTRPSADRNVRHPPRLADRPVHVARGLRARVDHRLDTPSPHP